MNKKTVLLFVIILSMNSCSSIGTAQNSDPLLTIVVPNSGEAWRQGSTHAIIWTSEGDVGAFIKIELYKSDQFNSIISSSTLNDGTYQWSIPLNQAVGGDYRVKISQLYGSIYDFSDGYFSIIQKEGITIISPNGGEQWKQGSTHMVTWKSEGDVGTAVNIYLYKGNAFDSMIFSKATNDGIYEWLIPLDQAVGDDYKVKISKTNELMPDYSDDYFSIISEIVNHPPNTPTITGEMNGAIKTLYEYAIQTTDPDQDDLEYFIDWGDHSNSGWIGPYNSGEEVSSSHSWSSNGTYTIKVKARDVYSLESDWGYLIVTMPYSYNKQIAQFFELLIHRFPYASPFLR